MLEVDKGKWNDQQSLFSALDAMGYSDSNFQTDGVNAGLMHTALARQDGKTGSSQSLINQLKDK